jgi:predicted RNase H-like HicB family nuclease
MTTPEVTSPSPEVQCARRVLAELAETGHTALSRERHLDVLLALDNLERGARGCWPPPGAARGITDVEEALATAQEALAAVLGDLPAHEVDPLQVALASDHVGTALTRPS